MPSKGDTLISNTKYLRCSEKDRTRISYYGIQAGIEDDGDPFSVTVEDLVSFKVSLLIPEEGS